jgi:hypothetical protein
VEGAFSTAIGVARQQRARAAALRGRSAALPQQLRQLRDIRRNAPRLVLCREIGGRSPAGLVLKIDLRYLKAVRVLDDKQALLVSSGSPF